MTIRTLVVHQSEVDQSVQVVPGDYLVRHVWVGGFEDWSVFQGEMDMVCLVGFDLDALPDPIRKMILDSVKDVSTIIRMDRP